MAKTRQHEKTTIISTKYDEKLGLRKTERLFSDFEPKIKLTSCLSVPRIAKQIAADGARKKLRTPNSPVMDELISEAKNDVTRHQPTISIQEVKFPLSKLF